MQSNSSTHLFPSPFHHPRQCLLSWFSLSVRVSFASSARTNLSAVLFGYLIYSHRVPCFCSFCQGRIPIIFDTLASPSVRSLVRWSPSFLFDFAFSSLFCLASDGPTRSTYAPRYSRVLCSNNGTSCSLFSSDGVMAARTDSSFSSDVFTSRHWKRQARGRMSLLKMT